MDTVIRLIADGLVLPIVLVGVYMLLRIPKGERYKAYCRILLAGLTAYLVAKLAATIYQPAELRPFELLGVSAGAAYLNNPGFPSDHVLFCMAITLAVWFETGHKKVAFLLLVATIAVAAGRVLALVHTPLDVIGGFIIACAGIPWYLQRDNNLEHKLAKKRKNV